MDSPVCHCSVRSWFLRTGKWKSLWKTRHLGQWSPKCHNPKVWGKYIHDELLLYTHTHTHTHLIKQIKLQRLEWRRDKNSKGSLWQSSHCGPPYRKRCLGSQSHEPRAQGFSIPSPADLKTTSRAVQAFFPGLLSQAQMKPSVQTFPGMRRGLRATLIRSAPQRGRRKKDGKWSRKVMLSPGQHISAGLWGVKPWPIRSCESLAVGWGRRLDHTLTFVK